MRAEFTWRFTETYCTLIKWDGVLTKSELPYEYVNGPGPKFWHVSRGVADGVVVRAYVQLSSVGVNRLEVGSVVLREDFDALSMYLVSAAERLSDIRIEIMDCQVAVMPV